MLDGAGSINGRTAAFGQAMALKPDGIVIVGFDAVEQAQAIEQAKAAGIPMVPGMRLLPSARCRKLGVFANVDD